MMNRAVFFRLQLETPSLPPGTLVTCGDGVTCDDRRKAGPFDFNLRQQENLVEHSRSGLLLTISDLL
jgi:hypothetical protein